MKPIPFVWTNDDLTVGMAEKLRQHLALIERFNITGSFFVIPESNGRGIDTDTELLKTIASARDRGHEFYQHGHLHTPFESGVPETWMLNFAPEVCREYDVRRLEIEKLHTLPALINMLEAGQSIWRRAFHEDSTGYRPAWGAFCGNLYRALSKSGYQWVSARIPSPTSWLRNLGQWDAPINFRAEVPADPHLVDQMIEIPMGGEYAFRVPDESGKIAGMIELALQEMEYCYTRGWPMGMLSHWVGLERNGGTGYTIHKQLIPKLLATGKVQPMTMAQLFARSKTKLLPQTVAAAAQKTDARSGVGS